MRIGKWLILLVLVAALTVLWIVYAVHFGSAASEPKDLESEDQPVQTQEQKLRVACFGDSITNGIYCDELAVLGDYETYNYGIPGNKSEDLLARIGDVIGKGYNYTIVLVGTNDVGGCVASKTYYENLDKITRILMADGQKVVLSTIPPFGRQLAKCNASAGDLVKLVNMSVRRVSFQTGACYTDIYENVFAGLASDALFEANGKNDGVHPNQAGLLMMAKEFNDALKECKAFNCDTEADKCF